MGSLKGPLIILEDDDDEKMLLSEVIAKIGLTNEVKFFGTGIDLIDYLMTTKDRPFLIISDVNIPRMTGLEVKEKINQSDFLRRKSIPFVYFSTSATLSAVEKAYDLNAQGFFLKQNTISDIEKHLRIVFEYWKQCRHTNSD
jgi:CheY-like chemotaxis protein